jgi:hypothetical protein
MAKQNNTSEYVVWMGMIARCNNPKSKDFKRYGGRGIRICLRWNSFPNFFTDMGPRPSSKHSIDRIDNNGDYKPGNCRWVTYKEQARNRRNNRLINIGGKLITLEEASTITNIKRTTLQRRLDVGWPIQCALAKPVRLWQRKQQ